MKRRPWVRRRQAGSPAGPGGPEAVTLAGPLVPTRHRAEMRGARLSWRETAMPADNPAAPWLLLLHGLGGSSHDWDAQVPVFAPHFRLLLPDLRGFGESVRVPPYDVSTFAEDLMALLALRGIGRCLAVAHSLGGGVLMETAAVRPGLFAAVVFANTLPDFRPRGRTKKALLMSRLAMMRLVGPGYLARKVAEATFPGPERAALRQAVMERGARNDKKAYLAALKALTRWFFIDRLDMLDFPQLWTVAEHDYFPREELARLLPRLPAAAAAEMHHFPDAHHQTMIEVPERFNARVLPFLLRHAPLAPAAGAG